MNASKTTLQELFQGVKQFVIPLFQRPYTWGLKSEWNVLWDDIIDLYESENPKTHFIGSIVNLPQSSVPEGVVKYSIIDGQQRLTTLFIILIIIRDIYKKNNDFELSDEINEVLLVNKFKRDSLDYYKFLPTQKFDDRNSFFSIINSQIFNKDNQITKAYIFFEKKIRNTKNLSLDKLKNIITNYLLLVSITLETDDNPYLVFESLNAKGTPLNASDLIRNYLFMRIHIDTQLTYFNQFWDPMEKILGDNLTEFIRHFLMKDGSIINKSDIYFSLKSKVTKDNAIEYLQLLNEFAFLYQKLLKPEFEENKSISAKLIRLNRIEVTTSYPMLLTMYNNYKNNLISVNDFSQLLDLLENYLIRRFISGKPTRELNKIFPSIIKSLNYNENIVENFKILLSTKGYPKDYEFEQGFSNMKFYGGGDLLAKTRLILETIENYYGHKEETVLSGLTIEHIMPQTINEEWKIELGVDFNEVHEIYKNQIGNLTLTGYNSELSNKPFSEKRKLLADSHLEINKYFSEIEIWNKDSIENRTKKLFEICNSIWEYFGSYNILTTNQDEKTYKPKKLIIFDNELIVSTWRDVLENTCEYLIDEYPSFMNNIDEFLPTYFSRSENSIRDHRKLSNGLFVHVGLSSKSIISLCKRMIENVGIDQENWYIEFE